MNYFAVITAHLVNPDTWKDEFSRVIVEANNFAEIGKRVDEIFGDEVESVQIEMYEGPIYIDKEVANCFKEGAFPIVTED